MLTVQGLPPPCWPAAPACVAKPKSRWHQPRRRYHRCLTSAAASRLPSTLRLQIFSHGLRRNCVGTWSVSPCSAYAERTLVPENASLENAQMQHRKEREARIRKQLQQVTRSPSAYDTAWVSMVPLPGSTNTPGFPQCIEWILQNQEDDGSWGITKIGSSVINKNTLLSTLACSVALKKWNLGEEHVRRGLEFIGRNFFIVMDNQTAAPLGFSLKFSGMLSLATGMGLHLPGSPRTDIDEILLFRKEEFKRLSMEKSSGTKAYIAYVSEGLGNLVNWSEVMKFQRKNGSLFNSPSATAALLVHHYNEKALQFLSSVFTNIASAVRTVYPLNIRGQLSIVDSLEKIGISQHFSCEIKNILEMTYSLWLQRDEEIMLDFTTCSIAFRLLRMNGYRVSPDELSHVAEVSCFRNSLQGYINDRKSLLELYKASKVSIYENELILDNIGNWSSRLLMELSLDGVQRLPIFREMEYVLKFPFYTTLERLDHRRNIENFDVMESHMLKTEYMPCCVNEDLLSLAIEDFTLSQCIYQDELAHLQSWVKEHKLDQLKFARQKATCCYLCAAGSITLNEQCDARLSFAKNVVLVTVIDDFFDGEESKEQLEDLIALVEKWDEHYKAKLYSQNVIILFSALYTTVKEIGSLVSSVQSLDVRGHLIETWLRVLRSMMIEAEWRMNQYVPTIEEYMKNAVVSISYGPVVLPTLCLLGQNICKGIIKDQEYNELLRLTSTCTRLLNDIQSLEREGAEGKFNSVSLLVHHSGGSMSIETAKLAIRKSIITTTRDLLRLVLREEIDIPRPCKEVFWKMCKMSHYIFFETDAYSSPLNISEVNALFYEPIKPPS